MRLSTATKQGSQQLIYTNCDLVGYSSLSIVYNCGADDCHKSPQPGGRGWSIVIIIFVYFGTFFAGTFSGLKHTDLVPMTISGENLMFGQPPNPYAPQLGTRLDFRNRPLKIFQNFFPLFETSHFCICTYLQGPGTFPSTEAGSLKE